MTTNFGVVDVVPLLQLRGSGRGAIAGWPLQGARGEGDDQLWGVDVFLGAI